MKNTHFAVFPACCLVSLLTGCQQGQQFPGHLTASKKDDTVQLCLSNELKCPQPEGVSPAGISVYRYDSTYDNELVWDAEPDNPMRIGRISGVITYGIPPENWRNKVVPSALICGKAYLVNPGANFFALKCDGSVVVFDSQHLEEFFGQQDHPRGYPPSAPTPGEGSTGGLPPDPL
jgi:hypothetical protein